MKIIISPSRYETARRVLRHLRSADVVRSNEDLLRVAQFVGPMRIQTVNLHHLALALKSAHFCRLLRSADVISADGWPVVVLFRVIGVKLARSTGADLVQRLAETPRSHSRFALVGTSDKIGQEWENHLNSSGKALPVRVHGPVGEWDIAAIAQRIDDAGAQLTFVAVTPPQGEEIAAALRAQLESCPVIAVGGAIDMLTGVRHRAPVVMQRFGLEWVYRLWQEPRRLARRYLLECLPALGWLSLASLSMRGLPDAREHV